MKQRVKLLALVLLLLALPASLKAQSFTLEGADYPVTSRIGKDTLRAGMFFNTSANYFLRFSGDSLVVWVQLEAPSSFLLHRLSGKDLPQHERVKLTIYKGNSDNAYLVLYWRAREVSEKAILSVWNDTDTSVVLIAGVPTTPSNLVWVPLPGGGQDTTTIGTTLCRDRKIMNFTGDDITITDLTIAGGYEKGKEWFEGVHYTVQNQPQFPLTIKDRDSLILTICYTPTEGDEYAGDSLVLSTMRAGNPSRSVNYLFGHAPPSNGIASTTDRTLEIYPNPVNAQLTVSGLSGASHRIRILDVVGREVMARDDVGSAITVDVGSLPPGIYYVSVLSADAIVRTSKLVIQH